MKAILEFNLPDDQHAFDVALKGGDLASKVNEFDQWLRGIVKHTDEETWPDAQAIREKFWEIMKDA